MDWFDDSPLPQSKDAAKNAPKGLPDEQLVPGKLVTLSPNKITGDRSYCGDVYEVVAGNAGSVIIKPTEVLEKAWFKKAASIVMYEHEFYSAEHIVDALRDLP